MVRPADMRWSVRVRLWITALIYGAFGGVLVVWMGLMWKMAASSQSGPLRDAAVNATQRFPLTAVMVLVYFSLAGLSFRFLAIPRPWRVVAFVASLLVGLNQLVGAARYTVFVIRSYSRLDAGLGDYAAPLAIMAGTAWTPVLLLCLCTWVLWRLLRAASSQ